MDNLKEILKKESLRLLEDTEYTFKAHFVAGERWEKLTLWLGISSVVLSVIAGSFALSKMIPYFESFIGIPAFGAATITALLTFLKPSDKYEKHLKFGKRYSSLRNDIRRFSEINLCMDIQEKELKEYLDKLITEKKRLDEESPLIPSWAYKEAKRRIELGETKYEVDKNNNNQQKH